MNKIQGIGRMHSLSLHLSPGAKLVHRASRKDAFDTRKKPRNKKRNLNWAYQEKCLILIKVPLKNLKKIFNLLRMDTSPQDSYRVSVQTKQRFYLKFPRVTGGEALHDNPNNGCKGD